MHGTELVFLVMVMFCIWRKMQTLKLFNERRILFVLPPTPMVGRALRTKCNLQTRRMRDSLSRPIEYKRLLGPRFIHCTRASLL